MTHNEVIIVLMLATDNPRFPHYTYCSPASQTIRLNANSAYVSKFIPFSTSFTTFIVKLLETI